MSTTPYITARLRGVSLTRAGRRVLTGIRWTVRPGQRWVLAGANGSGKTQLLKVLAGIVRPSSTADLRLRWQLDGEWHSVPYDIRERVAYVGPERQDRYQRHGWDLPAHLIVGTGIHGTDVPLQPLTDTERARVATLLARLGIAPLGGRSFLELSYGERRMILIARALIARPALLLLDEVFTGLDRDNHGRLMKWLARLRGGLPVVTVTHQLSDVPASATHLLVLAAGRVVHRGPLNPRVLRRYLGAEGAGGTGRRPGAARTHTPREPLVTLRRASVYLDERCALRNLSFSVRPGEFWVIHGANGAGKTTLLRTLYGDHGVASGGTIERRGIAPGVALAKFRARTGIAAPFVHARYPRGTPVHEVVLSGRHASIGIHGAATHADREATRRVLRRLGLGRWADRPLGELSYGQTRRVLLARALVPGPELLLLDEPFDSIDAASRRILGREIARLAREGVTLIVTAHALSEWQGSATHEVELVAGEARHQGPVRVAPPAATAAVTRRRARVS
jgi:molybdate transport system ATP-binding protein